jgi:hypothetical protein
LSLARALALRYDDVVTILPLGLQSWEWTLRAVELVKNRLLRATAALENAGIAYAVAGGNADAAWVGQVDQSADPLPSATPTRDDHHHLQDDPAPEHTERRSPVDRPRCSFARAQSDVAAAIRAGADALTGWLIRDRRVQGRDERTAARNRNDARIGRRAL